MKKCTKCKKEKEESQFHFRDGERKKRKSYCSECASLYRKKYYKGHRLEAIEYSKETTKKRKLDTQQFIWDYLSNNPCIVCNESDPIVLEFDHRDPSTKEMSVSEMVRSKMGIERIKREIEKCDILCSNCHKRRTAIQQNWYNKIKK